MYDAGLIAEDTDTHNTDFDRCARSRPTRMNPDGSCGQGLASLALLENAMIA